MKILHIAETAKGGVGTYLNEIVPLQTQALGVDALRVIVPADHRGQLAAVPSAQIIGFARRGRSAASLLALAARIVQTVAAFRPDIIHAHASFAGGLARLLFGWRRRRPVLIYCPHGWSFDMQIPRLARFGTRTIERLLAGCCDQIVAISQYEAAQGRRIGIPEGQITMIHNAIAATAPGCVPVRWPDKRRKILFIGRLDRQKGFDLLAEAVRGLEDQVVVRIAGAAVAGVSTGQTTATNIEFLGWLSLPQISGQLAQADVVVVPSRWEGFGLAALEAMRAGKPVIATRVGGLPELVAHGVTGRLIPPENVAALRASLLADDLAGLAGMGAAGQQRFHREFCLANLHDRLLDLYTTLLRK